MSVRKFRILFLRLCGLPILFLVLFVRSAWSPDSDVGYFMESAGYLFLLAGLTIRVWSILYIGGRKSQSLVTSGPYSLCRNPLYVGSLLLAMGAGLSFENIPVLAAILLIGVPVHVVITILEERHMAEKFPAEYGEYRWKTPRFLPRLRAYHSDETITVPIRSLRRVLIDTTAILLIPQAEDLLELLHSHDILPVLWTFPNMLR